MRSARMSSRGAGEKVRTRRTEKKEKSGAKEEESDTDPLALGTIHPPPLLF